MAGKLSTFGQLVKTIVPRASAVVLFDHLARPAWVSDDRGHADLCALAADLLASADHGGPSHSMRCALDAAASYAFLMREPSGALAGALALAVDGPFRRDEMLLPGVLEVRLGPILAAGARTIADPVERLLKELAATVRADAAVVSIPQQDYFHCHSAPESRLHDPAVLRTAASMEITRRVRQAGDVLCVDKARTAPAADPFRFISAPLRSAATVFGVLAVFAHDSRSRFHAQDGVIAARCAAQLATLLDPVAGGAAYFSNRRSTNRTDSDTPQVA